MGEAVRALVTGGTGFIGAHVVRALLAEGVRVRCLVRADSRTDNLDGLPVERVQGDLLAPASLRAAVRGCRQVYHCAADYRLWVPDPRVLYRVNVDGTDNLLAAAAEAGVERVVVTSSVGALGLRRNGTPADETTPVSLEQLVGHYKRSKYLAQQTAERWAGRGLPVVIVCPSSPIGEFDLKPTPTGRIVLDFLAGRMPAYVDTGMNFVDVRDVAAGHLLAARHGRIGERYILGHRNMSLAEFFELLAGVTGRPAPRLRLPLWLPLAFAYLQAAAARLSGRPPRVAPEAVRMARQRMYFDASKAVRELGLPQSPLEGAVARAAAWFRARGMVKGR